MSTEYGFSYDKEKCLQCFGCEVAYKSWRNAVAGIRRRRVYNIWSGRFPEVKMPQHQSPACIVQIPHALEHVLPMP